MTMHGIGQHGLMPKQGELKGNQRKDQGVAAASIDHQAKQKEVQVTQTDVFVKVSQTETKVTYDRPKGADTETIQRLKEESDQAYSQLRDIVRQLLERQGMSFQDVLVAEGEEAADIEVDDEAVREAQALIAEGGPFSPEAVSDRIVEMAMAFAGDDPEKMALMRGAIEEGFQAAKDLFGGQLPDISYATYDRIQEKLDAWMNEGEPGEEVLAEDGA